MAARIVEVIEKYPASCNRIECIECDGIGRGHRRTLTEGEFVLIEKVDGEWPIEALQDLIEYRNAPAMWAQDALDALAGGEQP